MYRRLLSAVLGALLLSACAPKDEATVPSYEYVVGISQANLIEPWRIALYEDILLQGANYSNTRLVFTDAAGDSTRQISDVHHLLEMGIDLLIISPNNAAKLQDTIAETNQRIPVIVLDREVQGEGYTLFIGSDNRLIGTLAGEYVVRLLGEEGGNVLEMTGTEDSLPTQAISQGFAEALAGSPGIIVLKSLDGDWLRDTAEMRMKDFLIKSEKVDIVFAHNDAMAYGAYIAANELRVGGISFIGVDGLENEGELLVRQGVLAGTFFRHTGGKEAVDFALKILQGKKDVPKRVILEPVPIVPDTAFNPQ